LILYAFLAVFRLFILHITEVSTMKKKKRRGTGGASGINNLRCPYCGSPVVLRSADGIYRENHNDTKLYVCSKYPVCDAYVRIQAGTKNIPLGSLANGELRALRIEAHRYFDRIHQTGLMSKQDAYAWLATIVAAPMSYAHIGQLSEYYCRVVIEESKRFLKNNEERIARKNSETRTRLPMAVGGE